jgi:hypothetical protein
LDEDGKEERRHWPETGDKPAKDKCTGIAVTKEQERHLAEVSYIFSGTG